MSQLSEKESSSCSGSWFNSVVENEIAKKKHGGSRIGAGRKKTTAKRYGFNAPEDVCTILEKVDDKTSFICEAILKLGKEKGLL